MPRNNAYDEREMIHKGRRFNVRFLEDDFASEAPWERCEGHGPVKEAYESEKRAGWLKMAPTGTRDVWYWYDYAEACRIARRDGWGPREEVQGETAKQRAARAVMQDFDYLRAWLNDDWRYIGVEVAMLNAAGEEVRDTAIFGVETFADYHEEFAKELADELLSEASAEFRKALKEARERRYWAARDVETRAAA